MRVHHFPARFHVRELLPPGVHRALQPGVLLRGHFRVPRHRPRPGVHGEQPRLAQRRLLEGEPQGGRGVGGVADPHHDLAVLRRDLLAGHHDRDRGVRRHIPAHRAEDHRAEAASPGNPGPASRHPGRPRPGRRPAPLPAAASRSPGPAPAPRPAAPPRPGHGSSSARSGRPPCQGSPGSGSSAGAAPGWPRSSSGAPRSAASRAAHSAARSDSCEPSVPTITGFVAMAVLPAAVLALIIIQPGREGGRKPPPFGLSPPEGHRRAGGTRVPRSRAQGPCRP